MEIIYDSIKLSTKGKVDIHNITRKVESIILKNSIENGLVNIFIPGATGALTTMEYENGLIKDTQEMFFEIIKENKKYYHDESHTIGNATSHLRASLIGPSLTIPIKGSKLCLGTWQEVVFIEFDNRPREREVLITIIGEKS